MDRITEALKDFNDDDKKNYFLVALSETNLALRSSKGYIPEDARKRIFDGDEKLTVEMYKKFLSEYKGRYNSFVEFGIDYAEYLNLEQKMFQFCDDFLVIFDEIKKASEENDGLFVFGTGRDNNEIFILIEGRFDE